MKKKHKEKVKKHSVKSFLQLRGANFAPPLVSKCEEVVLINHNKRQNYHYLDQE
jgi:hypothetical protein